MSPGRATSIPVRLNGIAAAPGSAVGPAWIFRAASVSSGGSAPAPTLREAATLAAAQLDALAERLRAEGQPSEAEIFAAQALMASDPMLVDAAEALVKEPPERTPADAIRAAAEQVAASLEAIDDALLAARAADVRDVAARIARILRGEAIEPPRVPSIAVADDLPPSVTVDLPPGSLLGIALESGTRTSHAAILARARRIPAVVAVAGLLDGIDGLEAEIALEGEAGLVIIRPDAATAGAFRERASLAAAPRSRGSRPTAGRTRDGHAVPLLANIGHPKEAQAAVDEGAEGVGLFRSEFIFMGRLTPPSEEDQRAAYAEVLGAFGPHRPVVIRLIDVGGDKAIPYLGLPPEANPFLGVRGLRLAYEVARPLIVTQIRAILRAAADTGAEAHLMAPMVATRSDVALLLELREQAVASLIEEGRLLPTRIVTGIMVEVPAAALRAARLASSVEFMSIGTNDLTQYMLAADRGNSRLSRLQDALDPAVLAAIQATVRGASPRGISVAVCGELASDPVGALVLVGLGVGELSMDPSSLEAVRGHLAASRLEALREIAQAALEVDSADEVRELVARRLPA